MRKFILALATSLFIFSAYSQIDEPAIEVAPEMGYEDDTTISNETPRVRKYPARLWEITGNGLKQPSYLYGTMHVSKKLAFNLGDTFYRALNNVDVVALELAIDSWLSNIGQNMQQGGGNFGFNSMRYGNGYNSFYKSALNFDGNELEDLLRELRSEDYMSNFLLYRQGYQSPDFSEKTYVDLYIHQIGKKLGKYCTGLEQFEESQRMVNRADWRDRKWPRKENYGNYYFNYGENSVEKAYREGDLDMVDSMEKKGADVHFLKWMLYERNKVMADQIEEITKNKRLFAAVGCAHLPGDSGVIEFLRRKGFTLTPVYDNVGDYAFKQKQKMEVTNTPVSFKKHVSHSGELSFSLPGTPVDRSYGNTEDIFFADVANGAYYVIKKLPYYGGVKGMSQEKLLKKLDSALYENIPGDITARGKIEVNGFPALDVSNRTKTGETQRHMYIILPNHVWYIKLNAPGDYAQGKEAKEFFKSIGVTVQKTNWNNYQPECGGYEVYWPTKVVQNPLSFDTSTNLKAHKNLEFTDEKNNYYFLKTINLPYYGKDEDTFHMHQIAENYAFYNKGKVEKIEFKKGSNIPAMYTTIRFKEQDQYLHMMLTVDGDKFYSLGVFTKDKKAPQDYLEKFSFKPYKYKYLPVQKFDPLLGMSYKRPDWDGIERTHKIMEEEKAIAVKEIKYPERTEWGYSNLTEYFKDSLGGDYKQAYPIGFPSGEDVSFTFIHNGRIAQESNLQYMKKAGYLTDQGFNMKRYRQFKDSLTHAYDSIYKKNNKVTYYNNVEEIKILDTAYYSNNYVVFEKMLQYSGTSYVEYDKQYMGEQTQYSISTRYSAHRGMSAHVKDVIESIKPLQKTPTMVDSNAFGELMVKLLSSKDSLDLFRAADYRYYYSVIPAKFNDTLFSIMKAMDKNTLYGETYANTIESKLSRDNYLPLIGFYMDKYRRGGDTSEIQALMLANLGRLKNKEALDSLLYWLLEETPLAPEGSYSSAFSSIIPTAYDSLKLWKDHYKKLLPLNRYEEYENSIMSLGLTLLDSNMIESTVFASMIPDLALSFRDDLKRKLSKSVNYGYGGYGGYGGSYGRYNDYSNGYSNPDNYEYGNYGNTLFSAGAYRGAYDYGMMGSSMRAYGRYSLHPKYQSVSDYEPDFAPAYYDEEGGSYNSSSNSLYDKAKILVRFYKQNPDVPKRLNKIYALKDDVEKMQFINLYLKHAIKMPDTMVRHYFNRNESQYGFVQMLKDRKLNDSIPKIFFEEKYFINSFVNYRHFTKKDTVVFLGKKQANIEGETGYMYFWKHKDKEDKTSKKDENWRYSFVWMGEKDTIKTMEMPRYYQFDQSINKKLSIKDIMNNEAAGLMYWKHPLWQPLVPVEENKYGYPIDFN
ncbi:MAG: TraB/GumN family protein [Bacteroidia bacterium]|nr:TraB/GumN family protein [Bacteroidia bacterium]